MELYLANKLTCTIANKLIEKGMFGRVQLARYISAAIALRYGTLGPSNSSFFFARTK